VRSEDSYRIVDRGRSDVLYWWQLHLLWLIDPPRPAWCWSLSALNEHR
jgi:hypothetical protein